MRVVLNLGVVLVCGALSGISSLMQGAPTQAAALPASMAASSHLVASEPQALVTASGHRGGSIEAHFAAANATHDGHLTQAQAEQADWPRIARHFDEIDADHKGWINVDQIHAFNKLQRAHRKTSPT